MIFEHQSKNKKLLLAIFVIILLCGVFYFVWVKFFYQPEPISCTMEAKLCPDGSYVGRIGPNCEFASCPQGISLPKGYTLEAYSVEESLATACTRSSDCEMPGEYQMLSRCPFTTICLRNICTVVCPAHISFSWDEAEAMINNCEVEKLSQRHNRLVTLFLKDGRQFTSIEPKLDRVDSLADSLKNKCGKIQVMTE